MHCIEKAIAAWKPNKTLIREKLVSSLILTFDESRRLLVLCFIDDKACIFYSTSNLHHLTVLLSRNYMFSNSMNRLWGGRTHVVPRHPDDKSILTHLVFPSASSEKDLVIIDSNNAMRVLLLDVGRCRCVSLPLLPETKPNY